MKNETTASGGNLQRRKRFPAWSTFRDGSRWRAFLHSRLWLGLLPAAAFGFGIVFLVALAGDFEPAGKALTYGLLAGVLNGLGWMLGIWAAVGPNEEDEENEEDGEEYGVPTRFDRFVAWLWAAGLLFLLIAFSDVMKLIDGTESWSKAAVAIVSKFLVSLCVCIPVRLSEEKR